MVSSYEAMTSARPYREAFSSEHALEELVQGKGGQYDPEVVDAFLQVLPEQDKKLSAASAFARPPYFQEAERAETTTDGALVGPLRK